MMKLAVNISFRINPEDLHVYSVRFCTGNTTPAGVEHSGISFFYKHLMPPASTKNGYFDSFRNIEQVNQSHQLKSKK